MSNRIAIFDSILDFRIDTSSFTLLYKGKSGTTGDPIRDDEIVAELKRQAHAHDSLAKALNELESALISTSRSSTNQ